MKQEEAPELILDDKEEEQEAQEWQKEWPFSPQRKSKVLTYKDKFIILILYCM